MTPVHAILIVIIRLWAAGAFISMLGSAPMNVSAILGGAYATDLFAAGYFLHWSLLLVAGLVSWFVAPWFARRVFPTTSDDNVSINVSAENLVATGSFLIGAFYLTQYGALLLVDIGRSLFSAAAENTDVETYTGGRNRSGIVDWHNMISNLSIVGVAAWMMFRPAYVARIFNWLRNAGHYENEKNEDK